MRLPIVCIASPRLAFCSYLLVVCLLLRIGAIRFRHDPYERSIFSIGKSKLERDFFSDTARIRARQRRAPAIWGEPAPDYSIVQLNGENIHLYALLFVDAKISDHYNGDRSKLIAEVMKLAEEANRYFYQIALRLIVVDIMEILRNDLTLYTFEQYRNQNLQKLPYHNFAVLVSYRYAGGLAFVSGMCSAKSVMMTGFYPHNPEAMGSIFFHEVAHLIGVPHSHVNETLRVPNCACAPSSSQNGISLEETLSSSHQLPNFPIERNNDSKIPDLRPTRMPKMADACLRIPWHVYFSGFDHDCTLQLMANLVHRNRCLLKEPLHEFSFTESELKRTVLDIQTTGDTHAPFSYSNGVDEEINFLYRTGKPANEYALNAALNSLPLCGNGVRERGEQCDCGLPRLCKTWNCDAASCTRPIPLWIIYLCITFLLASVLAPLFAYKHLKGRYHNPRDFFRIQLTTSRLSCSITRSFTLCGWCQWKQKSNKKWKSTAASNNGNDSFERGNDERGTFFQRNILSSNIFARVKNQNHNVQEEDGKFLKNFKIKVNMHNENNEQREEPVIENYRLLDIVLRQITFWKRNGNDINNQNKEQKTMKFMQILQPKKFGHSGGVSFSSTYTSSCSRTPRSAESTAIRPRIRPPPPPQCATSIPSSAPSNRMMITASPNEPACLNPHTITRASRRPKMPPPPCPVDVPPNSATSTHTSHSISDRRSCASNIARKLLPPPPPPPRQAIMSTLSLSPQQSNIDGELMIRVSENLPRPPSFAPPKTPEPTTTYGGEMGFIENVHNVNIAPSPVMPGKCAFAKFSISNTFESIKLAPLSIMTPDTEQRTIPTTFANGATSSLIEQIETEAMVICERTNSATIDRHNIGHIDANDMDTDRYSISHKFADFDDDDSDFGSDCDENNYSEA